MDDPNSLEKAPSSPSYQLHHFPRDNSAQPRWRHSAPSYRDRTLHRICVAVFIVLATWTFTRSLLPRLLESSVVVDQPSGETWNEFPQHASGNQTRRVALEAHIMSKCPDAKACLRELVVPAMEKVNDKVDFELSFIGSLDPNSEAVSCMHGPSECLGNMILLCAEDLYPDPKLSLGFANCMVADYHDIPERDLVEACAMEHSLDFKKINACLSEGGKAQELLRDSVERSVEAKVRTSCTIRLQGKKWCVTDGERDCNDGVHLHTLVEDVGKAYEDLNS